MHLPKSFIAAGIHCGIKKNKRKDLALIFSEAPCMAAGVFTTNKFKAAPIIYSQQIVKKGTAQAIVVNSGCANAATGLRGFKDTKTVANWTAKLLKISPRRIIVASTGKIGTFLPMKNIEKGLIALKNKLGQDRGKSAAEAILTTDKKVKISSIEIIYNGKKIALVGFAKGAGMVHPKLEATMLAFLTTDANISSKLLQKALEEAVDSSFNCISIEGETSTNDMVIILANGQSKTPEIKEGSTTFKKFSDALNKICSDLAQKIILDGEGATKLIKINVKNAGSKNPAKEIAESLASSPLIKTAFYGCNPNWGRVISRLGQSNTQLNLNKLEIFLQGIKVFPHACRQTRQGKINLEVLNKKMRAKEILLEVNLRQGKENAFYLTSDFSPEYVKINAGYS